MVGEYLQEASVPACLSLLMETFWALPQCELSPDWCKQMNSDCEAQTSLDFYFLKINKNKRHPTNPVPPVSMRLVFCLTFWVFRCTLFIYLHISLLSVCVCCTSMSMRFVNVCMWVCACLCVWKPEGDNSCLPPLPSTLFFATRSLDESGAHQSV